MTIMRMGKRGQSLTEYAILFSVVAAAYLGMQLYVKRGAQAMVKGASDNMAQAGGAGGALQYEPYYTAASDYHVTQERNADISVLEGYRVDKTGIKETTSRAANGKETQGVDLSKDNDWK